MVNDRFQRRRWVDVKLKGTYPRCRRHLQAFVALAHFVLSWLSNEGLADVTGQKEVLPFGSTEVADYPILRPTSFLSRMTMITSTYPIIS